MTRRTRHTVLPPNLPPLGLDRDEAAAFIGISTTKFDAMVADRRMPSAKRIDGRRVWSRTAIEKAFAALPNDRDEPGDEIWGDLRA